MVAIPKAPGRMWKADRSDHRGSNQPHHAMTPYLWALLALIPWRAILIAIFCIVLADVLTLYAFRLLATSNRYRR